MASVTPAPRKNGYAWRVQARENGKMLQETFSGPDAKTVERAARQFARLAERVGMGEAIRIRDERTNNSRREQSPTLAEWIDTYLDKSTGILAAVTDGTRATYRTIADTTIIPRLGELPVDSISDDDIARWVVWMEAQPSKRRPGQTIAAKTIRNHHGLLSGILAAADRKGLRKGNPARGVRITRTRRERMTVLTQSEFATLLHFIRADAKPLVMWLVGTGMRWGEATALTWGDLDRDSHPMVAHVTKAWQKAATGTGRALGPPKTEAGERTVSVPDQLVAELGKPGRGDALLFATSTGGPLWPGGFYSRAWKPAVDAANDAEACKKAGLTPIGKTPRLHDLRHCHASWMIAAGRPLPYIQARLGHEKITTTVDTYGHLLPDAQQGDADAISLAMAGVLTVAEPAPQIGS